MIIQNNLKFPVFPSFATPASNLGVGPLAKLNEKLVASGGLDKAQASVRGRLATPSFDAFRRANLSPLAKMLERMTAGMDDGTTETHGPSDDGYPSEKAPQDVSNDGGPSEHVPRMPQDDGHGAVAFGAFNSAAQKLAGYSASSSIGPLGELQEKLFAGMYLENHEYRDKNGMDPVCGIDSNDPHETAPADDTPPEDGHGLPPEDGHGMPTEDGHGAVAALASRLTLPLISLASVASRQRIY
jgi:hypothetical protein